MRNGNLNFKDRKTSSRNNMKLMHKENINKKKQKKRYRNRWR